jgi:hypothetical protein
MAGAPTGSKATPALELRQTATDRNRATENWSINWVVENKSSRPLQILAVHLPHGQFKSRAHRFDPVLDLAPGKSDSFRLAVRCAELPGLVTENAFVIFSVIWLMETWRIFVRIRVVVNAEGRPETTTEWITTQKAGFSGVPD